MIKKIIIEECGNDREISPGDIVSLLDHSRTYDFYLTTERDEALGEIHGASPFEIATYISGIRKVKEFHGKHRTEEEENQRRYVIRIREAA